MERVLKYTYCTRSYKHINGAASIQKLFFGCWPRLVLKRGFNSENIFRSYLFTNLIPTESNSEAVYGLYSPVLAYLASFLFIEIEKVLFINNNKEIRASSYFKVCQILLCTSLRLVFKSSLYSKNIF